MSPVVIFVIIICAIAVPVGISAITALVKTNYTTHRCTFNIAPSSYKDLIGGGKYIVDNTLLLEYLLGNNTNRTHVIHVPRRFGKTMSIQMIKEFLQIKLNESASRIPIEENENYRLFNEGEVVYQNKMVKLQTDLLIKSKRETMTKLGTIPVIHLNLQADLNYKIYSLKQTCDFLKSRIGQSFAEHPYLASVPKWTNKFHRYKKLPVNCDEEDIQFALFELSQMLNEYHKQRAYVLIDEYDGLINDVFKKSSVTIEDKTSIVDFFRAFYDLLVHDNSNIQGSLLTGLQPCLAALPRNLTVHYNESDVMQYYGLDVDDAHALISELKLKRRNSSIFQRCDVYEFGSKREFARLSHFMLALKVKRILE